MKFDVIVLIAAVTANCFVTAINGEAATDTLRAPYIDMLLPPLEVVHDSNKDAATKINATFKARTVHATAATTTTTKQPITNDENNILPELSIEALLPPLLDAKAQKKVTASSQAATTTTTTTARTATITKMPTTKETRSSTTTAKPFPTITATLNSSNLKVPDLFLEPLLPPFLDNTNNNSIVDTKITTIATKNTVTTQRPTTTTKKDQNEVYKKNLQKQQQYRPANTDGNKIKNYNEPVVGDKHIAESSTHPEQASLTSQRQNVKLQSQIETVPQKSVAKEKASNSSYSSKQFYYTFNLHRGTARPPKSGLPTITPFPHRVRKK